MNPNKNCIFFAGGKKFNIDTTDGKSRIRLVKTGEEEFTLELKLAISKEEAKESIFNFKELNTAEGEIHKKPNLVFLEAYEEETAKEIDVEMGDFFIGYNKEGYTDFIIKATITQSGKTDHPKTDHPNLGG